VFAAFGSSRVRKELNHLQFNDKAFIAWYGAMVKATKQQPRFPTKIINHYLKWLRFEATRDNSYIKPIMEGAKRIEVTPLPYIITSKDI
jgi:hypothetical protein